MGLGVVVHDHPLRLLYYNYAAGHGTCSRCELPVTHADDYYCIHCSYYIHRFCSRLPQNISHPLHPDHPLLFLENPPSDDYICTLCHSPCLGCTYHCAACNQFNIHLKCLMVLKHDDHDCSLMLVELLPEFGDMNICKACRREAFGILFYCSSCKFVLHFGCAFLRTAVQHRHWHRLSLTYTFPKESEQVFCDLCEEEADRNAYIYYCVICDYIAHLNCVTPVSGNFLMRERTIKTDHFVHPHLLSLSPGHRRDRKCLACGTICWNPFYHCTQCFGFAIHEKCSNMPQLMQHPLHKEHSLNLYARSPTDCRAVKCSCCKKTILPFEYRYHCDTCQFTIELRCALTFKHPSCEIDLLLTTKPVYFSGLFRCDACGELGHGLVLHCIDDGSNFDLHLECFALPNSVEHECHPHPLSLTYRLASASDRSSCNVCDEKAQPHLWAYYCGECTFVAHLSCVAGALLSTRQACNSKPGICTISLPEALSESKVKAEISTNEHDLPYKRNLHSEQEKSLLETSKFVPHFQKDCFDSLTELIKKIADSDENSNASSYSCLKTLQHFSHEHALTFLEELPYEGIYCYGCLIPIFPPAYGCISCKKFLHKSCTKAPYTCISSSNHTIKITAPEHCCNGFWYFCERCHHSKDLTNMGLPFIKHKSHLHRLQCFSWDLVHVCRACLDEIALGDLRFSCKDCRYMVHIHCALAPYTVTHGVHRHPLDLTYSFESDEYYCQVCEEAVNTKGWAYYCSECDIIAHIRCLIPLRPLVLKHKSHPHILQFCFEDMNSTCRACLKKLDNNDSVLSCTNCSFELHVCCAIAPCTSNHPIHEYAQHDFELTFSFDSDTYHCKVCGEQVNTKGWAYYCPWCSIIAHIHCVT